MKITFEFDTDSENFDNTELEACKQANKLVRTLNDITECIRSWEKWESYPKKRKIAEDNVFFSGDERYQNYKEDTNSYIEKYPEAMADPYQMCEEIWDILRENNVNMEDFGY